MNVAPMACFVLIVFVAIPWLGFGLVCAAACFEQTCSKRVWLVTPKLWTLPLMGAALYSRFSLERRMYPTEGSEADQEKWWKGFHAFIMDWAGAVDCKCKQLQA